MSETMSSPSDHWGQFYHQMIPPNRTMFVSGGGSDGFSDATVVTTTVTSTTTTAQNSFVSGNSSSTAGGNLSPEGRVSKPVRRRSRASRRTPTTLLNTDTTNFRAMVQQFTGGPSGPFGSGSQINAPSLSFAMNPRQNHANPGGLMVPGGFHLQYQQQQQYQQPSQPSYMFSLGNNNNSTHSPGHGDHVFFQRLGNPRPGAGMEVSDGLVMAAAPPPSSRPAPTSSSNENRSNTFLF